MRKAQEYRHQAQSCLELANTAEDQFTKEAMKELATEFLNAADRLRLDHASRGFSTFFFKIKYSNIQASAMSCGVELRRVVLSLNESMH